MLTRRSVYSTSSFVGLVLFLLVACSPSGPRGPELMRLEITPGGLLLTDISSSKQLSATALDANGNALPVTVTWESSQPEAITVDETGIVTARVAEGSSQIVARMGSVRSAPVVVVAAELVSEAVLVNDAQIVGGITPLDETVSFGAGFRYTVTLQGITPTVGKVLVASESAPLVGRVVTVTGNVVTLEVIPLDEVVTGLELDDSILDMARAPLQFLPEIEQAFDIIPNDDGSYHFMLKQGRLETQATEFNVGPFACEVEDIPVNLDFAKAEFTLTPNLSLDKAWNSNLKKLVVTGTPTVSYSLKPLLSVALNGKVGCKLTLAEPKIPLPGFLGFFLGGVIPIGVGFELEGKFPVAGAGVEVSGQLSAEVAVGFNCVANNECTFPRTFEQTGTSPKIIPVLPQTPVGVKFETAASAFVFAGLEAGITSQKFIKVLGSTFGPGKIYRLALLEAKGGLKLEGKLASEETQLADETFSANYALSFEAGIAAGKSVTKFVELVKLTPLSLEFKLASIPLGMSPQLVNLSLDQEQFEAGDNVTFTVNLAPASLEFLGSHNVDTVRIYRVEEGVLVLANEANAAPGQQSLSIPWVASVDSSVGMRFVAFVKTAFFPDLRLELGVLELGGTRFEGEITVLWREEREYDETFKAFEDSNRRTSGGFFRSNASQEWQSVMQVEAEQIGDDLIFTIFDQNSQGLEIIEQDLQVSYTIKSSDCTTTDTSTVDGTLTGSSSELGRATYDGEVLELAFGVPISGNVTVVFAQFFQLPCERRSGTETEERSKDLFRTLFIPILLEPDAPETFTGSYSDTTVTPTDIETDAKVIKETVTETLTLTWNLQPK
jgi:hypothetical protein